MSVFFSAEGRSLTISKSLLTKSKYFSSLLKNELYSEVSIAAPDWMPYRSLETYLNYLKTDSVPSLDPQSIQKLLWISDYFEDSTLQEKLIEQLIPILTRDSALLFLQDSTTKISSGKYTKSWKSLQNVSKEIVTKNLRYTFVNHSELFDKLDTKIAEEIIEESLSLKFFTGLDHSPMLQRLKNLYTVNGMCELVQRVESKILESPLNEVYVWRSRVKSLESEVVESPVFYISTTKWQLNLSCHKSMLKISICFKTEQICENSVVAVYIQVLVNNEPSSKSSPKLVLLPLAVLKSTQIKEVLLTDYNFSLVINARVEFIYSALIQELIIRPENLLSDELGFMPFECLEFVLGLRQLAVRTEDTVLEIISKWTDQQKVKPNENELEDLLNCVRWDFISTKALISSASTYTSLKDYQIFKTLFKSELESKLTLKHSRHKPRNSYKLSSKETFSTPKDYIDTLSQTLLDLEITQKPKKNSEMVDELYTSIIQQENEIKQLRHRYDTLSLEVPTTPGSKLGLSAEGFYRVPGRLRGHSSTKKPNFSPMSTKNKKTGFLLNSLLKKLNTKGKVC